MSAQTPRKWFEIKNAAAEVAEVSIFDEISPWGVTAQDFLHEIAAISAPRVNLHLNTPGGLCDDGIAIYNGIKSHPAEFYAFVPGICASIGTVIAMAADRIAIAPHARMMIHDAWGGVVGSADDFVKAAARYEALSQNIASVYAERAGGTTEEWRDRMKAESWYTDSEAVDVGLADEVGRPAAPEARKQAALFNLAQFRHGEREAARLLHEWAVGEPEEPSEEEPSEPEEPDPPSEPQEPAPEPESKHVREAEALEAAIQGVSKEAYLW